MGIAMSASTKVEFTTRFFSVFTNRCSKPIFPKLNEDFYSLEKGGEKFKFKITEFSAYHFPSGVLMLYVTVKPEFPLSNKNAILAGKTITNTLCRSDEICNALKWQRTPIKRVFSS